MANTKVVYWHRELPPLSADPISEHVLEATSSRVPGTMAHHDDLWRGCYEDLMRQARVLAQVDPKLERTGRFQRGLLACVPGNAVRTALANGDMGFLHSFTTGSTVDGPGVRVVAWATGCMWRCLYCHNPDTWTMSNGLPVTVARATEELRKYRHGLKVMSGGFTLSGGEPLMQHRFAVKLLTAAKALGVHTALDTNGYYGDRVSDAGLEAIDLVLLDIKAWDRDRHRRLTGMDNTPTLEFARRLAARKRPVWLRFVLVPGLTDNPEDVANIARFSAGLGNVERVDVLPFHQMGRDKWHELALPYALEAVNPPSTELIEKACAVFRSAGLRTY